MVPVIYILFGSLILTLVAARISGRVFFIVLLPLSPILVATLGTLLMHTLDLSVTGALFMSILLLTLLIGMPYAALSRARRRRGQRD